MKRLWTTCLQPLSCLIPAFAYTLAWAAEAPVAPDLMLSKDRASVIDRSAQLVWSRCVEGMKWNGKTCTGVPALVTQSQAIALAAERAKADGVHWRLPRPLELQRLVNDAGGLDPKLFPGTPSDWHWAIKANVDPTPVNPYNYGNIVKGLTNENANHVAFLHGWAVNMVTGEARGDVKKRTLLPVRLVRSQD